MMGKRYILYLRCKGDDSVSCMYDIFSKIHGVYKTEKTFNEAYEKLLKEHQYYSVMDVCYEIIDWEE